MNFFLRLPLVTYVLSMYCSYMNKKEHRQIICPVTIKILHTDHFMVPDRHLSYIILNIRKDLKAEVKTLKEFISSLAHSIKHLQFHLWPSFSLKKYIRDICNGSSTVHPCIVQSPFCTNVHSVHCTILGCVDKK